MSVGMRIFPGNLQLLETKAESENNSDCNMIIYIQRPRELV